MFVPFDKLEFFGSGQLVLPRCTEESSRRVPCRVKVERPSGNPARGGVILASALIREGGGYNAKTASKASLPKSARGMAEHWVGGMGWQPVTAAAFRLRVRR